ncbi:anthranilate synthase component I [Coraliomargarita sp. SDUM461004]|uniref:Anthranilate synthase component 1 n=1 Tax=Thalassobacterium sedimentorum TaxID=3041258 RepID=A0ABU1AFD1_9BACT|nr:anthranilate synthase component I [Coraliomargarita sp. SDUM461004]MDQ8193524.1 anthranilate synthase component I [Coraliomargarita sp. SDUM461004]
MNIQPTRSEFKSLTAKGNTIPIYLDLTADCETPLGAYSKIRHQGPAFLFESIVGGERISRFSFLGANPRKVLRVFEKETTIQHKDGSVETIATPTDPLNLIESEMAGYQPVELPDMPPFCGGAVGFVGHEFIHSIEPTVPKPSENPLEVPILYYMIADSVLVFDHVRQILRICVHAHTDDHDTDAAYNNAVREIERIYDLLEGQPPVEHRPIGVPSEIHVPEGNFTQARFEDAVDQVKSYVRAGDVIQTVLSQRFVKEFKPTPVDLYRALRTVNPSPYMFLMEDPDFSVVGASPEVHVRLTGDQVEIRPIAGTRHRGKNEAEDLALEQDLLADDKEKAEHLMLVDLARNDIGRVCQYGSIRVPDYMTIERYSHVMHIVSQVVGTIRPECTAYDLMRATFPAGTLSGAPKVRALQIISELENSQRGIYGGALGYFEFNGNHDSCIGIRTAVIKNGKIYIQSGAGIVADSVPESEFMETINKAKGMLKAVALAENMFNSRKKASNSSN